MLPATIGPDPAGAAADGLSLWGGAECTVNRIGNVYRDQTRMSGHHDRPEDLDRFAALGIARLRYPVLWERVCPDRPDAFDWRWSDERIRRIRRLGMAPIVGLLHHGSGPRYTGLTEETFPELLGRYAGAVAARYPDVADWTPINEPLTTARFSALYGHWYPHARDERTFWGAVLNQIDGTRAAMRAIRTVLPAARLIQTEDLGRCYATESAGGVAEVYNQRRWATWDLLAGRVDSAHALWSPLERLGFGERLRAIADDPCPADVIGVNHYLTSDRFLDDRTSRGGPPLPPEGYHDRAAIRVLDPAPAGLAGVVREAWERYGTAVAVTECHLGCTREEQLRWLAQAWRDCVVLRGQGVEVVALTAWALLGSIDWDSLLTRSDGHYEVGAFDIRADPPRATAIAALLATLGRRAEPTAAIAAVAQDRGWWQRPLRLEHAPFARAAAPRVATVPRPGRPLLITGAGSALGQALAGICRMRGISHVLTDRLAAAERERPWAVIDAGDVAGGVAASYAVHGIHLTRFPRDAGIDDPAVLTIRTGAVFAAEDTQGFAATLERRLRAGRLHPASPHHRMAPTYRPDLVQAILDLVVDGAVGSWCLTHGEAPSELDLARRLAAALGLDAGLVVPGPGTSDPAPSVRGSALLPSLDDALARYAAARRERHALADDIARVA